MEMRGEGKPADYAVMRWNNNKYFVGKVVVGHIGKYTMIAQCTNEVHAELVCEALNMASLGERTAEEMLRPVDRPAAKRTRKYAVV